MHEGCFDFVIGPNNGQRMTSFDLHTHVSRREYPQRGNERPLAVGRIARRL